VERAEIWGGTFNISTLSSIIIASCKVHVAKHGGRKTTSHCGSIDILEHLGLPLATDCERAKKLLNKHHIAFLFAPCFHPILAKIAYLRQQVPSRTIFNLLGPLLNPAKVKRQVIGVYDRSLLELIARVLNKLGTTEALIVHSEDGLDELSIASQSYVTHLKHGRIHSFTLHPEQAGLTRANAEHVLTSGTEHSAAIFNLVLRGEQGPCRDIVLLNASAGLLVAGKVADFSQGVRVAAHAIDSGQAQHLFKALIKENMQ
jgi:anthranilate phosphoribosyltransferase